ncbi:N-acetyl sugar amidotransferase [Gammaproteobacteria bacterium]|nr:N-acetyl sugar amidotransferase [Gammaproteobacteria bacterium]
MSKAISCKKCLYDSNHPLGLELNNEGICSGCLIHQEKDHLDWNQRWDDLENLIKPYKCKQKVKYDCIVPVTGANDSYYIMHLVKNKLNLNPLVVTYNKYFNTPLGIKNLANLRSKFDVDILIQNINPHVVKKVTKATLKTMGSMYWPSIAGQTVFPVQTSVRYKIPLIIWGAHQGIEQVGMFSHLHNVQMTRRYRKDHDLMGFEADDLLSTFNTLSEEDICQYRYPSDSDLRNNSTIGIYLGNYVRWDPKAQHEEMVKLYNYESTKMQRTFDTFDHGDCYNFMNIHDHIKHLKTGYSKVTDHATREIRHGRITKKDALKIVNHYESQPYRFDELFYNWLGVEKRSLDFVVRQFMNKKYWTESEPGNWKQKKNALIHNIKFKDIYKTKFIANSSLNRGDSHRYITIGKGHP